MTTPKEISPLRGTFTRPRPYARGPREGIRRPMRGTCKRDCGAFLTGVLARASLSDEGIKVLAETAHMR